MLELTDISKVFFPHTVNERRAWTGVSVRLASGDFATVIGSNGGGQVDAAQRGRRPLHPPEKGTVAIDDHDVTAMAEHRRAAMVSRVFQDPMAGTAPPHLTIEENLAIAYQRGRSHGLGRGITRAKREFFRTELTTLELGLENRLGGAKVGMLSGGQRQALSLLMATFVEPRVLLLDEHTAALDPTRSALISRLTAEAVERHRLTTLMVTHNMQQALDLGNRLLVMHEGNIVLEVDAAAKQAMTADQLLDQFRRATGGEVSDRTLLTE